MISVMTIDRQLEVPVISIGPSGLEDLWRNWENQI